MTYTNQNNLKLFALAALLFFSVIIILSIYSLSVNKGSRPEIIDNQQQNNAKAEPLDTITNFNEYINYKNSFGLSFPDYWKGFKADEKNGAIEFSLKDRNEKYSPIFNIKAYSDEEFEKIMDQSDSAVGPIVIVDKDGFIFTYLMIRNDYDRTNLGNTFESTDYSGFYFDVKNNIIPTFKFIKKGEVFDTKNKFQKDYEIKLAEAKVGDIVGNMTIEYIKPFPDSALPPINDYLGARSIDNLSMGFSGEISVTGTYHNDKVDPATGFGGQVCFDSLDEQSKKKIPKVIWSDAYVRFCFSNQDFARNSFQPEESSGIVTIIIKNYIINKLPAEVTDMATLVKVVSEK